MYFLPAGFTFAIWGMIIIGSVVYAVYQTLPAQTERTVHRQIGWPLMVNSIFFSVWTVLAIAAGPVDTPEFQPGFLLGTVVVLAGMLAATGIAFVRLHGLMPQLDQTDRWLAAFPAALYYAWLNVAAIANTTSYLYGIGLRSNGALWATLLIGVAVVLACVTIIATRGPQLTGAYAGVILWALLGIAINNLDQSALVTGAAAAAAIIVAAVTVYRGPQLPERLPA